MMPHADYRPSVAEGPAARNRRIITAAPSRLK
jgi:hypothetical protein